MRTNTARISARSSVSSDEPLKVPYPVARRSKIGGYQTVHTKEQRDFAAMMQIVFHHMIDHPTARYLVHLTVRFIREGPGAVVGCPALQAGFDECPRLIEAAYQFHRAACW